MTDNFFPPPPRPRGKGWRRRCRQLVGWIVGSSLVVAVLAGISHGMLQERREFLRLAREGNRVSSTVVNTRRTSGKSPTYYATIRMDGYPHLTKEVRIDLSTWKSTYHGSKTVYYHDTNAPRLGMAELERGERTSIGFVYFAGVLGLGTLAVLTFVTVRSLRQMRLLRIGMEFTAQGAGGEVRISQEGRTASVRIPESVQSLIAVPNRNRLPAYVVLLSPDLRHWFFPQLLDVPVERLVGEEQGPRRLPDPTRAIDKKWDDWSNSRLTVPKVFSWIFGIPFGACLLGLLCSGFGPGWAVAAFLFGGFELLSLLVWQSRRWRNRYLWREGDEVHAVLMNRHTHKGQTHYRYEYVYRGREFKGGDSWEARHEVLEVPSPAGAPAVTKRVVILVDPYDPRRSILVPKTMESSNLLNA